MKSFSRLLLSTPTEDLLSNPGLEGRSNTLEKAVMASRRAQKRKSKHVHASDLALESLSWDEVFRGMPKAIQIK